MWRHRRRRAILYVGTFLFLLGWFSQLFQLLLQSIDQVDHPTTQDSATKSWKSSTRRRWAYAFLIGGVGNPQVEYRGYLYSVMVAVRQLQTAGSQADFILYIQVSSSTKLSSEEEDLLTSLKIRYEYLPRLRHVHHEGFYTLMLEKFRILQLTEYSRVLYLDADILPFCNLDYLLELSDPMPLSGTTPLLKENVILGRNREPSHGGLFILKPNADDYRQLQTIIRQCEEESLSLPYPHWDEVKGWGHIIEPPDHWRSPKGVTGTNWTWHGSFADQGLLYYYTKYYKQSVSAIVGNQVDNWGLGTNQTLQVEKQWTDVLTSHTCRPLQPEKGFQAPSPYRDFVHLTGSQKAWRFPLDVMNQRLRQRKKKDAVLDDPRLVWYDTLLQVLQESGRNISLDFFGQHGSVGEAPAYIQRYKHIVEKSKNEWNQYVEDSAA